MADGDVFCVITITFKMTCNDCLVFCWMVFCMHVGYVVWSGYHLGFAETLCGYDSMSVGHAGVVGYVFARVFSE